MEITDFSEAELKRTNELMKDNTVRALIKTRDKYIEKLERNIRMLIILNFILVACLLVTILMK